MSFLSALSYYLLVFPLSLLPMSVLYLFSSVLHALNVSVFPYRNFVITRNLMRSFPEKSPAEIKALRNEYYKHFADIVIEGVKNLSIRKSELKKRFVFKNTELLTELYTQGKSVILVAGHYNNWEWMITSQALHLPHKNFGIGMPLSSAFWDKKLNQRRSRFGLEVVHAKNYKEKFETCEKNNTPFAVLTLVDQSPSDASKSYWTKFLNQDTAVLFGAEMMAHQFDAAVVYFKTRKVKRGFYEVEFELITAQASSCEWGEITEKHNSILQDLINEAKPNWLWSHKRWKREKPQDLDALKTQQRESFNRKFKP